MSFKETEGHEVVEKVDADMKSVRHFILRLRRDEECVACVRPIVEGCIALRVVTDLIAGSWYVCRHCISIGNETLFGRVMAKHPCSSASPCYVLHMTESVAFS